MGRFEGINGISDREICFVVKDEIKTTQLRKGMESNLIYNITFWNPGYVVGGPCQEKTSSGR